MTTISNTSTKVDWEVRSGLSYKARFTLQHPITGEALDITDIILDGDARVEPNTEELFAVPIKKLNQLTNRGQFEIELTSDFTLSLGVESYPKVFKYDIRMTYPNGEVYLPVEGTMTVTDIITKDGTE